MWQSLFYNSNIKEATDTAQLRTKKQSICDIFIKIKVKTDTIEEITMFILESLFSKSLILKEKSKQSTALDTVAFGASRLYAHTFELQILFELV